jgi:hypothetical protein
MWKKNFTRNSRSNIQLVPIKSAEINTHVALQVDVFHSKYLIVLTFFGASECQGCLMKGDYPM